jgi:hypothetical protein
MNPYASFLGSDDPFTVIAETPAKLKNIDLDWSPGPGKWNGRQILAHLADTEIVFAFRLRQAVAEKDHVIQPFDQDGWAAGYSGVDAQMALAVFTTVRQWNVDFIKSLPAEAFSKTLSHPERGPMTLQTVVETMAGHDLNHLAQFKS